MKALILLGGLGSRLRPFTLRRPKPLLPILNRPFIGYQLDLLKKFGVRDVVLALGYHAAHFRRHLGDGRRFGLRFRYSLEKEPLGTGGAIRHAMAHLPGRAFVLNGDVVADFDLARLARGHARARAQATLALVRVENPASYGLVQLGERGVVKQFLEKPSVEGAASYTINAGCYVLEPGLIARIPAGRAVSIERETFPGALAEGVRMLGVVHAGYWSDIGTLVSYWQTHMDLLRLQRRRGTGPSVAKAPGVRLGKNVVLEGAVSLGQGVVIEAGAHIKDSVILEKSRVGARARVDRALIGADVRVGEDCQVGPGQVLADGARLPAYSRLLPGLGAP